MDHGSFEKVLVKMATNAAILHEIIEGYVSVWRKTYKIIQLGKIAYPAVRLVLNGLAITNVVAAMDDVVNRVWKELHDICDDIVHRTCEDVLDAELFKEEGGQTAVMDEGSMREIARFFVNMMLQLSASAYLDPKEDSRDFREYVNDQLRSPFNAVKRTLSKVIWCIQMRNAMLLARQDNGETRNLILRKMAQKGGHVKESNETNPG